MTLERRQTQLIDLAAITVHWNIVQPNLKGAKLAATVEHGSKKIQLKYYITREKA